MEAARIQERLMLEKKAAIEAKRQQEELLNGRQKKIVLLSERAKRINPDLNPKKKKGVKKKAIKAGGDSSNGVANVGAAGKSGATEEEEKVQILSMIADELSDPARDCR